MSGGYADKFLIGPEEMKQRTAEMQKVCAGCHATSWVDGHFHKYEAVIGETNLSVRAATALVEEAWSLELAQGPAVGGSMCRLMAASVSA